MVWRIWGESRPRRDCPNPASGVLCRNSRRNNWLRCSNASGWPRLPKWRGWDGTSGDWLAICRGSSRSGSMPYCRPGCSLLFKQAQSTPGEASRCAWGRICCASGCRDRITSPVIAPKTWTSSSKYGWPWPRISVIERLRCCGSCSRWPVVDQAATMRIKSVCHLQLRSARRACLPVCCRQAWRATVFLLPRRGPRAGPRPSGSSTTGDFRHKSSWRSPGP